MMILQIWYTGTKLSQILKTLTKSSHFSFSLSFSSTEQHISYSSVVLFTFEADEDQNRFKEFCLVTKPGADSHSLKKSRFYGPQGCHTVISLCYCIHTLKFLKLRVFILQNKIWSCLDKIQPWITGQKFEFCNYSCKSLQKI